jgi:ketosteroid isomerase-like protein
MAGTAAVISGEDQMAHPNEDVVRAGFAAYARGDIHALRDQYFAADIRWHYPGRSIHAGDYNGLDEVMEYAGRFAKLSGGTHRMELNDVIGNDNQVVALHTTRAERNGKKLEVNAIHVFHVQDGKVTEAWTHHADLYSVDEFWS